MNAVGGLRNLEGRGRACVVTSLMWNHDFSKLLGYSAQNRIIVHAVRYTKPSNAWSSKREGESVLDRDGLYEKPCSRHRSAIVNLSTPLCCDALGALLPLPLLILLSLPLASGREGLRP